MIKFVNQPCNSSLATSCAKPVMASSFGERKVAALFTEGVSSSAEVELAIDEAASTVSLAPNVCVVPGVSVAVREGEECVEEFVDLLSGKESDAHFSFWKEKLMTMRILLTSCAASLRWEMLSRRVGRFRTHWHVLICLWRG